MSRPGLASAEGPLTERRKVLFSLLFLLCVAGPAMIVSVPDGLSRGDNGEMPYRFSCSWTSLTADFASRDELP